MARINIRGNRGTPSIRLSNQFSSKRADVVRGEAIADIGQMVTDFANQYAIKKSKTYAAKAATKFKNDAIAAFEQAKKLKDVGSVEGFTPEFIKKLDELGQSYINEAPTSLGRDLVKNQFDVIKSSFFEKAIEFENAAITAESIADIEDIINENGNGLLVHPDEFQDSLGTALASIEAVSDMMTEHQTRQLTERATNTLAVSAVRGQISENSEIAMSQLTSGKWDKYLTPEQKNSLMGLAQDAVHNSNAVAAFELERRISSDLEQVQQLGYGNGLDRESVKQGYIAAGMPKDRAEVKAREYELNRTISEKVYQLGEQLQFATPEGRDKAVANFKPKEGSRTFDLDQRIYEAALKRKAQVEAALEKDPMGYALTSHKVKEAFDPELGGSTSKGMKQALILQSRMLNPNYNELRDKGLSASEIIEETDGIRVLSEGQVDNLVNQLNTNDVNEILGVLGGLRDDYVGILGDDFVYQKALQELADGGLNPGMAFAVNAVEFRTPGSVELIKAVNTPMTEVKKVLGENDVPYSEVEKQVQSELTDFKKAFIAGDPTQTAYYNSIEAAIVKMAGLRIASGLSEDEDDAAEYAYENVINSMFHVTGNALIPRIDYNGDPVPVEKVEDSMDTIISYAATPRIRDKILKKGHFPGTDKFTKDVRFRQLENSGSFVNASNGRGYHLQIINAGVPMYLLDEAGNPVVFTNEDILEFSTAIPTLRPPSLYEAMSAPVGGIPISEAMLNVAEEPAGNE